MKPFLLVLALLGLCSYASAAETWFDVSPTYAKPFRSMGYEGSKADGIGAGVGIETCLTTTVSVGFSYEQLKIDQTLANPSYLGFATATLRWMPHDWSGLRPYLLFGFGALTQAQSSTPAQTRQPGTDCQGGLGVLFTTDQAWGVDLGAGASTVNSGSGLNLLQAHAGVFIRFGR